MNIKADWEKLQKDHNEIMEKIRSLQQAALQNINEGNKHLAEINYSNQKKYQEFANCKQRDLEALVNRIERVFSA